MKKMSKKASTTMDYHTAYLKVDAVSRNLDLEKFRKDLSQQESSDSDSSSNEAKNVSLSCKY